MTIPIRSLYYMFCYAWRRFPDASPVEVGVDDCPDILNLFAKLLVSGCNRLMRRGLDRGYSTSIEETRAPRGKMLMDAMVKSQSLRSGLAICEFDELSPDVPHNQILKATARMLARTDGVEREYAHELAQIVKRMDLVSDAPLTAKLFGKVQLGRNTGQYRPLLHLCDLARRRLVPDERGEGYRFAEILRDEVTMSTVFEEFLRGFYKHEQRVYSVKAERMEWDVVTDDSTALSYLPTMLTDLTLTSPAETIVMDAKYYSDAFATHHGARRLHSHNLYQLVTYLQHARGDAVRGILVYPGKGEDLSLRYRLLGYDVGIEVIDFAKEWSNIRGRLLSLVET